MFDRPNGTAEAGKTTICCLSNATSLDITGMQVSHVELALILSFYRSTPLVYRSFNAALS